MLNLLRQMKLQMKSRTGIKDIPPELFPLIASFLPLRTAPKTLRSLALGNRRLYRIVRPLLWARLVIPSERHVSVMTRILDEPELGLAVREIYILSEQSVNTRLGYTSNIILGLHTLLKKQLVPRLVALGIFLLNTKEYDHIMSSELIFDEDMFGDFWRDLRKQCPHLHTLLLRNFGHECSYNPWVSKTMIDEVSCMSNLSVLRLESMGRDLLTQIKLKILGNLACLGSSLHTLALESEYRNINFLFPLNFPNLKWLSLSGFAASQNAHSEIMSFFERHPQLESLSLAHCFHICFKTQIEVSVLPNLRHLKVQHADILLLVAILPHLLSLAIVQSHDRETSSFIRSALPNTLPHLESLEIELRGPAFPKQEHGSIPNDVLSYMDDIARLAPNVVELGLRGIHFEPGSLPEFGPALSRLVNVERFYYSGTDVTLNKQLSGRPPTPPDIREPDLSGVWALARGSTSLKAVIDVNSRYYPYIARTIDRDSKGGVKRVRMSRASGMEISAHEDDPFP